MQPERKLVKQVVFTSYATSLDTWRKAGILQRERRYIELLGKRLGPTSLVSYSTGDEQVQGSGEGLRFLNRKRFIPNWLYSVSAPLIHWKEVRKTDVVRTYQLRGAWTAALASLMSRKPFVLRTGYVWSQFKSAGTGSRLKARVVRALERFTIRRASVVITASEADRQALAEAHNVDPSEIHVIPNPVDTELFASAGDVERQPGLVTYVGRLESQKRVDRLIDAVRLTNNLKLRVIGDGSLRESLEKQADGLDVEFMGRVSNEQLPELLA